MPEILNPGQIIDIKTKYGPQERLGYDGLWESLLAVCESHEVLRAQMVKIKVEETPLCRAAPALLAALEDYLEAEDIYNNAVTPQATAKAGYVLREKREAAQVAIAKAKGETP